MKTILTIFIILLLINTTRSQSWNTTSSNTTNDIYGIDFTQDSTGWAITYLPASILKSTDYGNNWTVNKTFSNTVLTTVTFFNDQIGWAGGSVPNASFKPRIFKTIDGGQSWLNSTYNGGIQGTNVNYISTIDSLNGYAFGHNGLFMYTNNGVNWNSSYIPTSSHIWSGYVFSMDTILAASDNLYMFKQTVWETVYVGTVYDIDFITRDTGFAITDVSLIKTIDGGNSWNTVSNIPLSNMMVNNIEVTNSNLIYIGGYNREIFLSTDGGNSWEIDLSTAPNLHITDLLEKNGDIWATGKSGQILNKNALPVAVKELESNFKELIHPNPTTGIITIDLRETKQDLKATLINGLGQVVYSKEIVSTNSFTIDIGSPKGIYFLRLESKGEVITRKIIKE